MSKLLAFGNPLILLPLWATVALPLAGCPISSGATRVSAFADSSGGFGSYRSYAFADPSGLPSALRRYDLPERDMNRIRLVAREVMVDRGFQIMPADQADLLLYVSVGERTRTTADTSVAQGPAFMRRIEELESQTQDHTVVVDAVERISGQHVWHGRSMLTADRHEKTVAANEVRAILAELPESADRGESAEMTAQPIQNLPAEPIIHATPAPAPFGEPLEPSGTGVPMPVAVPSGPSFSDVEFDTEESAGTEQASSVSDDDFDEELDQTEEPPEGTTAPDSARASGEASGPPQPRETPPTEEEPPSEPPQSEFDDEF